MRQPGTWPIIHHLTDEDIAGGRIVLNRGILAAPRERRAECYCHSDPPASRQRSLWNHLQLFNDGPTSQVQLHLLLTRNKSYSLFKYSKEVDFKLIRERPVAFILSI